MLLKVLQTPLRNIHEPFWDSWGITCSKELFIFCFLSPVHFDCGHDGNMSIRTNRNETRVVHHLYTLRYYYSICTVYVNTSKCSSCTSIMRLPSGSRTAAAAEAEAGFRLVGYDTFCPSHTPHHRNTVAARAEPSTHHMIHQVYDKWVGTAV